MSFFISFISAEIIFRHKHLQPKLSFKLFLEMSRTFFYSLEILTGYEAHSSQVKKNNCMAFIQTTSSLRLRFPLLLNTAVYRKDFKISVKKLIFKNV